MVSLLLNFCMKIFELPLFVREKIIFSPSGENLGAKLIPEKLPKAFFITLFNFILFVLISKFLDFFLAISILSIFISYYWGERRFLYLFLVSIIFPIVVFIFFETILGLRFPPGIITNLYYY